MNNQKVYCGPGKVSPKTVDWFVRPNRLADQSAKNIPHPGYYVFLTPGSIGLYAIDYAIESMGPSTADQHLAFIPLVTTTGPVAHDELHFHSSFTVRLGKS